MDSFVPILLLALCAACAYSEPLQEAMQRRSDEGVYAHDYSRNYEPQPAPPPLTFAAYPLHHPIPVVQLLSPTPHLPHLPYFSHTSHAQRQPSHAPQNAPPRHAPSRDHESRPAQSVQRPIYALPSQEVEPYRYSNPYRYSQLYAASQPYAASQTYAVSQPYATNYFVYDEADESAPTILYARPNPNGGYTYRRRPTKKRNTPKKHPKEPKEPKEPVIIRVHKYRVVKDLL